MSQCCHNCSTVPQRPSVRSQIVLEQVSSAGAVDLADLSLMLLYRCIGLLRPETAITRSSGEILRRAPAPPRPRLATYQSSSVLADPVPSVSEQTLAPVVMTEPLEAARRADKDEYKLQLEHKIARVKELFQSFQLPPLEVHESSRSHYRMRCVFY